MLLDIRVLKQGSVGSQEGLLIVSKAQFPVLDADLTGILSF